MSMKKHVELIESLSSQNFDQLNEDVDTNKAKKEIKDKIKDLQKAIDAFSDMSDDAGALLQAMPSGMKNAMSVQKSLSGIDEKLDALKSSLDNAQDWDSEKLNK